MSLLTCRSCGNEVAMLYRIVQNSEPAMVCYQCWKETR